MKTMVKNKLGSRKHTITLPSDNTVAQEFADTFLDGEYQIFEKQSDNGASDVESVYYRMTALLISDTNHLKAYINLVVPQSKSEDDVRTALMGKTINGVKAERIIFRDVRKVVAVENNDSSSS